jgi:hypothetical protein
MVPVKYKGYSIVDNPGHDDGYMIVDSNGDYVQVPPFWNESAAQHFINNFLVHEKVSTAYRLVIQNPVDGNVPMEFGYYNFGDDDKTLVYAKEQIAYWRENKPNYNFKLLKITITEKLEEVNVE